MTARILSGKEVAAHVLETLRPRIKELNPKLVVVQVGNDPASESYIRQKMKSCAEVSMRHEHKHLPEETSRGDLLRLVQELNDDSDVTGFIVQLPLPAHLKDAVPEIIRAIDPARDVDGFGSVNVGKVSLGREEEALVPATPAGVMTLLNYYEIEIEGKNVVIVGHSNIVGKPLAAMFLNRNATVTVCNKHTANLLAHTQQADILCSAVGKHGLITSEMVKPGAVVIDIGTSRTEEGLKGDVDFDAVKDIAAAITPVPGGIGPMTVASLIRNCVLAAQRQRQASRIDVA